MSYCCPQQWLLEHNYYQCQWEKFRILKFMQTNFPHFYPVKKYILNLHIKHNCVFCSVYVCVFKRVCACVCELYYVHFHFLAINSPFYIASFWGLAWRSGSVMDCHAMARGSIPVRNGVFTELHVLHKGQ